LAVVRDGEAGEATNGNVQALSFDSVLNGHEADSAVLLDGNDVIATAAPVHANGNGKVAHMYRGSRRSRSKTRPVVSVVVPAKNEARNLAWVLRLMPSYVDEVVLVDGNSTDDTIEVARAIRPDIVVVQDDKPGKGAALRRGFETATGEFIVMIDADGSMDPSEIGRYVELLHEGYDFVKGSRFMAGGGTADMTHLRNFGNSVLRGMVNVLYGTRFTELCYGLMAFRASKIPALGLDADGFEIETQIVVRAVKAGLRTTEAPSYELPRRYGESNLRTFRDGTRVLRTLLKERLSWRRRPAVLKAAASGAGHHPSPATATALTPGGNS
jgi:glycosyltransferase involved in cell wall biosynthesis